MRGAALALIIWAGAAQAQQSDLPEGYPPLLGGASGTLGQKAVAWEFFDFSIGAFDASAWVDQDWDSKLITFHLMGYSPGQPDDMRFRLLVEGNFGTSLRTGTAEAPVRVSVLRGKDTDGAQLSSEGQHAEVVIEAIGPQEENSYLRHVTGSIMARVCPKAWLFKSCQDIALRFDTDVQMGSAVDVAQ
jgi:hypothetical protein